MYITTPHTCNAFGTQKRVLDPPGIEVTVGCEPPYGFWELNLALLQEQQVLVTAEQSLLALILLLQTFHFRHSGEQKQRGSSIFTQ